MGALGSLLSVGLGACKKDRAALETEEKGRLRKISENLEEAYAKAPLPPLTEPVSLAERVEKWDDFRSCTVRTYVARKRDADRRVREGAARRTRHASIGDETIEECAVQLAVAKKEREICDRLAVDYAGPNGEQPLAAARCFDTRARVFGLPEECPLVWLPHGVFGRNLECLAIALRDGSLCPYAESPGRCRAILNNDATACTGPEGAPDCTLAVDYWQGLIPAGFGKPMLEPTALASAPLDASFDLRFSKGDHASVRVQAPKVSTVLTWPAGKLKPTETSEAEKFWGFDPALDAAQITWNAGDPALKLAFIPGGAPSGTRKIEPPSRTAAATVVAVWSDSPGQFLRCQPSGESTGEVRYDAGTARPGAIVTGTVVARRLLCSDGSELDVQGKFRLFIAAVN